MKRTFFGIDLRIFRAVKGISLTKSAYILGVDKSTLSRWERGIIEPDWKTQDQIYSIIDENISQEDMNYIRHTLYSYKA